MVSFERDVLSDGYFAVELLGIQELDCMVFKVVFVYVCFVLGLLSVESRFF